ncbi:ISC system FeS cluster assembly, IscU scaffold like protein [Aduncisulcus paluster]|uniref:Iron-sulfur cluster assembly protein n=1 Tax=Aduncisulcus paluster TaxID=2918883 RepID=A0ABQ5K1S7_9EUKA|nr:ISC system FeS cluster assembly, IscU scaffold like protein [Aduncisulcus paluster]
MLSQITHDIITFKGLGTIFKSMSTAETTLEGRYSDKVSDHYNNPRNVGTFDKEDPSVGTAYEGAPACGDVLRLQLKVDDKTGKIVDAKFKAFGCMSAIASSSYATELVKGKTLDEAGAITNKDISEELALPPIKLHCSMLAEQAIQGAIENYKKKKVGCGAKNCCSTDSSSKTDCGA